MKIGIDLRPLQLTPRGGGIWVYCSRFIHALSSIDKKNEYFFFCFDSLPPPTLSLEQGFQANYISLPCWGTSYLNFFHDEFNLVHIPAIKNMDVIHFLNPFDMRMQFDVGEYNKKVVLTVHDFIPHFASEEIFTGKRQVLKFLYDHLVASVKKVGHIICVSLFTQQDLKKIAGENFDRSSVIYEGKEDLFTVILDEKAKKDMKRKYSLPDRFAFYVGRFSSYKNLANLIDAFSKLKNRWNRWNQQESPPSLVIAGSLKQREYPSLKGKAESLGLKEDVRFIGFVPDEDLPYIYNLATCFVFPSKYEGFGLPLLEAFACGTPVLCSHTTSLGEIAGDSAYLFHPERVEEISEGLFQVFSDAGLRKNLREKGLKRAEDFSWDKCAIETLDLYKKISAK